MNYSNHHAVFTNKVKHYTVAQCDFALKDCHNTLQVLGDTADEDYLVKVWAEIDALRERQLKISKGV